MPPPPKNTAISARYACREPLYSSRMSPAISREIRELIEANRTRALWWLPLDYFPDTDEAVKRTLQRIAARGDRQTFVRAS